MEEEGLGKSWLGLGIGGGGCDLMKRSRPPVQFDLLFPQSVKEEAAMIASKAEKGARKRLKVTAADEDGQSSGGTSHSDDEGAAGAAARKKLRLTKEQSTLLEDTFHAHNILSHAQKQELARQVNLSARQVEVWFQNRRARTKLKQTEVDCEILKRCCESLTGENQRLRLELAQLQRSAAAAGLYFQSFPPAATAMASVVCPSCDKVTVTSGGDEVWMDRYGHSHIYGSWNPEQLDDNLPEEKGDNEDLPDKAKDGWKDGSLAPSKAWKRSLKHIRSLEEKMLDHQGHPAGEKVKPMGAWWSKVDEFLM